MLLSSLGWKTSKEIALLRKCSFAFDYDLNENDLEQQHTNTPPKKKTTHDAYL